MQLLRPIRIFISSPGDVSTERAIARKVFEHIAYDPFLRNRIVIQTVAWDRPGTDTPLFATMTPQEAIDQGLPKPSECDVVIVILWSRIGTLLPLEYLKPDGSRFLSGTEWEYWDALTAAKQLGKPALLVYRRTEERLLNHRDDDFEERLAQLRHVDEFFRQFQNEDGSIRQGYNSYRVPDEFREKLDAHIREVLFKILNQSEVPAVPQADIVAPLWNGSPFPGLRSLTPRDEPIFFGRGRETDALVKRVSSASFVAVIGASGSGKSSLVGAGLIPRLKANAIEGSKDWLIPEYQSTQKQWTGLQLTPAELGDDPVGSFGAKLASALSADQNKVIRNLHEQPQVIFDYFDMLLENKPKWSSLLIFIDQFEELLTVIASSNARLFITLLTKAVTYPRAKIVVTLRSDFYHRCLEITELATLLEAGSFPLSLPSSIELHDMIIKPAERAGVLLESGLAERIILDTGNDPGSLALMAYLLDELYQIAQANDIQSITMSDYEQIEGVQGAIGARAESIFTSLQLPEKTFALINIVRELVDVDDRGEPTRKRASYQQITSDSETKRLVDAFIEARLFVSHGDAFAAIVEVAHEALLRNWDRLSNTITTVANDLRLLKQVTQSAQEWNLRNRPPIHLWSHERLSEVYEMRERLKAEFDPITQVFLTPEPILLIEKIKNYAGNEWDHIQRLSKIGKDAYPYVIEELLSPYAHVRYALVQVLRFSYEIDLTDALLPLVHDPSANIRRFVTEMLERQFHHSPDKQRIVDAIIRGLNDTHTSVRNQSIESIMRLGISVHRSQIQPSIISSPTKEFITAVKWMAKNVYWDEDLLGVILDGISYLSTGAKSRLYWDLGRYDSRLATVLQMRLEAEGYHKL